MPTVSQPSRRTLNAMLLATAASSLVGQADAATAGASPVPFRVDIPQATINRILDRVRETQWPDRLDAPDWRYGANWDYMRALAKYWVEQYDWRKAESNLNRYPQFLARLGDFDIHFYHVKGRGPRPVPLILTHGWPGSVVEFLEAIGPLSDPASYGGSADGAFDVVVPSLPGFAFSSKPAGKPIGLATTASLWNRLMTEVLSYPKYGAQGGDWGSGVTAQLARQFAGSIIGVHFNGLGEGGSPPPESEQSSDEKAWRRRATEYRTAEFDYFNEQRRKPETVAFALADNPVGTAAWIVEKLKVWSDPEGYGLPFTMDQVLTDVMLYLVTNAMGTSIWFYRGTLDEPTGGGKFTAPTGFVSSPHEFPHLNPPQTVLARNYNLVHYTKLSHGGHFAFFEQPQAMAADVREFFRMLRT
ncbi:MAG TPA: epoxide hydrolase [Xanthobacteraceae bacterium]|nr:epoxide hydrolase [Xanthobacteraceae bacterium]